MITLKVNPEPRDPSSSAEVDRCDRCGGYFIEFFDGEPSAISRAIDARKEEAPDARLDPSELVCPDCSSALILRAYLGQGPDIARCDDCMAVFVSRKDIEALARLELSPEEREKEEPSWMARLFDWLPGLGGR
jgi:Zn-finger nucleic acid-binding protein